ncbi:hypothetical protein TD95_005049 [Thielaviopsis punctulata]|uniref:Membrane anchor Opy2 N-terminal domain-containing protein n=1 Tax=Thielaviopsis punctulata TaxID=72032 RepID=A0A0F4Z657_9PEZI|nr:hypothetical protein TD95_005049 [Thielaviopsis punctulata]
MDFDFSAENIVIETTSEDIFRQALKARDLYPRNDSSGCAVCQSGVTLKCDASCYSKPGYECVQVVSVSDCRECPGTKCRESATGSGSAGSSDTTAAASGGGGGGGGSKSPNAGIIAGATIGGIVLISLVAFFVWFFFIKKKRAQQRSSTYSSMGNEKNPHIRVDAADDAATRNNRLSSHTVHSVASTVLTRASNIIQIAYIPGVTNRANSNAASPTVLVPPVPPIPIQVTEAGSSTPHNFDDEHYFMPGDLRASTYSDMSGFSDRTSYARQSYAMRNSVASTIYGKGAVATSAARIGIKPAMVSVRSAPGSSPVPPMPTLDADRYTPRPKSRAESTFSVGSTYVNSASAATAIPIKGQAIRVISSKKSSGSMSADAKPTVVTVGGDSGSGKTAADPFSDPEERPVTAARMSAVMEEEPVITSPDKRKGKRDSSPFSDAHATRE